MATDGGDGWTLVLLGGLCAAIASWLAEDIWRERHADGHMERRHAAAREQAAAPQAPAPVTTTEPQAVPEPVVIGAPSEDDDPLTGVVGAWCVPCRAIADEFRMPEVRLPLPEGEAGLCAHHHRQLPLLGDRWAQARGAIGLAWYGREGEEPRENG